MIGRAGIISAASRHRRNPYAINTEDTTARKNGRLLAYQKRCEEDRRKKLKFVHYPMAAWLLGILMVIVGLYLIWHVGLGKYGRLFNGFDTGQWWQYFISCVILILGISFLVVIRSEKVEFDTDLDRITLKKKNFCLKRRIQTRKLSSLFNIQIVKRGHNSIANKTIHYKIILNFMDEKPLEILESNSKTKIKKRYIELKTFLRQEVDVQGITIIDESTSNYDNNNRV